MHPPSRLITVRYFAAARAAARTGEEVFPVPDGATVGDLVAVMTERHGADLARVLGASTFLVDEIASARDRPLAGAGTVDVLPPFAGG